jgi:ligand-binding SRPBCC domain-containing protein
MPRRAEVRVASRLRAESEAVWERAMSEEGINAELGPWMRMTVPRGVESLDLETVEPGRLGRSWILLFGLIPFDYDDIGLVRIERGRGFLERSTMLSQRLWEHERTIEPAGDGACTIVDRLAWEPRLPLPGRLLRPLIRTLFRHRHRQLQRHFGGEAIAPGSG